jgi:uncharacterized protein (DUF885 family)
MDPIIKITGGRMYKHFFPRAIFIIICACLVQSHAGQYNLKQISDKSLFKNEQQRLEALFEYYADMYKENNPGWATMQGFKGYEGKWAKSSLADIKNSGKTYREVLKTAETFDDAQLSESQKIYFNLLKHDARVSAQYVEMDMFYFPVDQQGGSHLGLIYTITSHPLATKNDVKNTLLLLGEVDKRVDEVIEILNEGVSRKLTAPKVVLAGVPDQIKSVAEAALEDNPFYSSFKTLDNFEERDRLAFQDKAKILISEKVIPAYKKLYSYIVDTYIPACRDAIGLSSLADGEAKYNYMIQYFTTTNLTAKEIHQLGLSEVKRIRAEMEKAKEQAGFKGDLEAFNTFLRTDPQFFYTEKEALLAGYRDICKRIDPELVKLFGKLPRLPYGVKAVPEYQEKSSTTAYYNEGSISQGVPGYYYANTYKLETRPKWEMEVLSIHEAVPGHHLQISLAQEITSQPDFMKFIFFTVFVEGWGLYSESLGPDLGMYKDPYSKYGQLTYEMWRAIRLVVDTGIHAFNWSREEAIDYFMKNSAKTKNDITVEIDRYIAWPGQALAYKMGELKFKELKNKAREALGEKFDIRKFHDLVLSEGALPLSVLENMVNDWIKSQK